MNRAQSRRRRTRARKLRSQQARRLAKPHPGVNEKVREQRVPLVMPAPPRRIPAPVREPAAQPDVAPQQVVLERHELHRRRSRMRLGLGVDADLPHPLRREHSPVDVPERQVADQALIHRPGSPLVQRRDQPAPRGHRHLRRSWRMQPRPLIGAQVGGTALPDRLASPGLRQEPAEQHDVPRIRKDTVRCPDPPPVQIPEEPVELQVIRTVRTQQERQTVSHSRPAQRCNATSRSLSRPRPHYAASVRCRSMTVPSTHRPSRQRERRHSRDPSVFPPKRQHVTLR